MHGQWHRRTCAASRVQGVIDSGLWIDHPMFAPRNRLSRLADPFMDIVRRRTGTCEDAEEFKSTDCSNKLVACRHVHVLLGVYMQSNLGVGAT